MLYLDSKSPSRFKEGANQFAEILKLPTLPLLPILLTKKGGNRLESVINGYEKVIHEYRMDEDDTTVLTHASRIDPHYPKMLARWFDMIKRYELYGSDMNGVPKFGSFDDEEFHFEPDYDNQSDESLMFKKYTLQTKSDDYQSLPFKMIGPCIQYGDDLEQLIMVRNNVMRVHEQVKAGKWNFISSKPLPLSLKTIEEVKLPTYDNVT